jgi:hypothetical protein
MGCMALRQISNALSDGSGRSEEIVWLGVAALLAAAALYGIVKAADTVLDLGLTSARGGR